MANIPGAAGAIPGVYDLIQTQSSGAAVPGGVRIAAIIGEGLRSEILVSAAQGGGKDGLNPTYTSTSGSDGRHFALSLYPIISNRTTLFKNGIPLKGLEGIIDGMPFSNLYDYKIDIATGHIELQTAHLADQGGSNFVSGPLNTGIGTLNGLTLLDLNAPSETWSIRCVSVQRTPLNAPIANTAKFVAVGSVSGNKLDSNGNPIVWVANNQTVSNGILSFAIYETSPFLPGDYFSVVVTSGALVKNNTLTSYYTPSSNINDPEFLQSMSDVVAKHGPSSISNNLSLGCQLAFANTAPGIMCVQAAPSMPRRTSYLLTDNFLANSANTDDFLFPLPTGVVPDPNSNIHFFIKNNATNVESQILPNLFPYYTIGSSPTLSQFITDNTLPPAGYSYSYSLIQQAASVVSGLDGYIQPTFTAAQFSSSYTFDASFDPSNNPNYQLKIIDAVNAVNVGSFRIIGVSGGKLLTDGYNYDDNTTHSFIAEGNLRYEIVDTTSGTESVYIVVNKNIAPAGYSLRANIIDNRDASFYDAGWLNAIASLEKVECDIVVPLPKQTISVIFQNALQHCITMSSIKNRKERVLFAGSINGLTPDNLTGAKPAAVENIGILEGIQGESYADVFGNANPEDLANYSVPDAFGSTFRCVYFYPDQIVVQAGTDNVLIDGFYIAAAAAGYLSASTNVAIPLTNKVLSGFTILRNKQFSTLTIEQLVASGVCVLQPVTGGGNVVWGLTTTQSGYAEEQEISIVFIRDRIAKSLRSGYKGYIGIAEDDTILATLSARGQALVSSFISQGLITAYKDLVVQRDSVDPRQWNVSLRVQPTYPVNWIFIKVGIGIL